MIILMFSRYFEAAKKVSPVVFQIFPLGFFEHTPAFRLFAELFLVGFFLALDLFRHRLCSLVTFL